jgi:DNA-binding beta-propeller fold protein YncE
MWIRVTPALGAAAIAGALASAGCSGCDDNNSRHIADAPRTDTAGPIDAALFDASDPDSTILIAVSPPGPGNGDPLTWSGVLQFQVSGDGTALVPGAGLDKALLADPAGLAFRSTTSEVFVGNRHGNNAADGTAGSISRFQYSQSTHALVALPELTGNGLDGVHQVVFSPTTGELFAANVNAGVSRFTFDVQGAPVPHGTISDGPARGVMVAPDGKRLYVSTAANVIRQFDLATGAELPAVALATTGTLHFFAFRRGELYVAALGDDMVYRYTIDASDQPTFSQAIAASSPIAVAFSADGEEMYVTGHLASDILQRYTHDTGSDTWIPAGTMDLGVSLGGIVIVPG